MSTPGKIPTGEFIKRGELAINTADKKIFSFDGINIFEPGENSFLGLTGGTLNGNLYIEGSETETQNLTVHGNLIVEGTSFTSHTENVYISANTITLNNGEINSGVTKGYAGILVDRGTATQYEFAFEESSDTFRVGETGNTQAVATREDSPINGGYAYWNENEYKFDTTKDLSATTMSLSTISADTIYTHSIIGMSSVNINGVVVENASISANTLNLAAGTTSKAPIQLASGDLLDAELPGALEFQVDNLYLGISTGAEAVYVSQYPPEQNDTFVKVTSYATGVEPYRTPYRATDPTVLLTGEDNWYSANGQNTNQRFHIDLGVAKVINRIYYENNHRFGYDVDAGIKNFTLWGSNSATDFNDLTYANNGTWVQITGLSQNYFDKHAPYGSDVADPRYITFSNTTSFRYYALKIVDNWSIGYNYMGLRRIELQTGAVSYPRCPIVLADENKLTENKLPIATTNGRLVDSLISQTTGGTISISGNTNALSFSATSISASTLFSGGTNLYDIFESSPTIPGGSDTQIQYNANGSFSGDTGFTYVNGMVGIGVINPAYALHVSGSGAAGQIYVSSAAVIGNSQLSTTGLLGYYGGIFTINNYINNSAAQLSIGTKNVEAIRIDNSQNVGIGTISPSTKLHIATTVNGSHDALTIEGGNIGASYVGLLFKHSGNPQTAAAIRVDAAKEVGAGRAITFWGVNGPAGVLVERMRINTYGNVGIGTTSPTEKLVVSGNTTITGDLVASTKSFVIPHPTKEGKKLHYGSLEGPEHGVYYRGRLKKNNVIELPDYWEKLVDENSISVELTPIGNYQKLFIKSISNNKIYVGNKNWFNKNIDCYFTVFAMREKINVEE